MKYNRLYLWLMALALAWCGEFTGQAQTRPELVIQTGHADGLKGITFSPDGKLLASSSIDNAVLLWDVAGQQELRSLAGLAAEPDFIGFGAQGRTLVVGNRTVNQSFDITTGAVRNKLPEGAQLLALNGDVVAAKGNSVELWRVSTGEVLRQLEDSAVIDKCLFSPDGKLLVGTGYDGMLRIWDANTGRLASKITGAPQPSVSAFAISANGRWVAAGGYTGAVMLWEVATGRLARSLEIPKFYNVPEGVLALTFTPDERGLVRGGVLEVALYDVNTGRKGTVFGTGTPGTNGAQFLAVSPDGRTLATAGASSQNKNIELWDMATGQKRGRLAGRADATYAVAFSGDGKNILTAGQGETLKLWDVTGGALRPFKGLSLFASTGLAFSPDGKFIAAGSGYLDKTITLREVASGREAVKIAGHPANWVRSLAYSPDGAQLATLCLDQNDKSVKLWDTRTGQLVQTLAGHTSASFNLVYVLGGKVLVSGGNDMAQPFDASLRFWDTRTGALLRTVTGAGGAEILAASPDGKLLATVNSKYALVLYDAATGAAVREIKDATGVHALAFSPDSKTLAIGKLNNEIDLYSTLNGAKQRTLTGHTNWITSLSFHPNGTMLLSGSRDGQAKLWDTGNGAEIATLLALNDNDWLVVTPDGLFDGSPNGWQQVIWRYDSNTFSIVPLEYFFNEYFYPNLLPDLLSGKRPRAPSDLARKDRRQPSVKITLAEPAAGDAARTAKIRVTVNDAPADASHRNGSGALDLRLFRNGALVKAWRGDVLQNQAAVNFTVDVPVIAGANQLTAYAFNRDNVKSQTATLAVTGADSLKRAGVMRMLAIGVNKYANDGFNLRYAVADADEFAAEIMRQQKKLNNYVNIELVSLLDANATKANILKAISDLAAKTQPEDAVVVYFAGHGTAQDRRFYLIPHDLGYTGRRDQITEASVQQITAHSVSDRELERAFEGIDAGQFLLVIDACNSGQALEAAERRRGPMNSQGLAQLAYEKGMYILTAAQSFQAAQEAAKLGHGYLTYALVTEGLQQAKGDMSRDGVVKVREWLDYATGRVPQMQVEEMKRTRSIGVGLVFLEGDEKEKDVDKLNVQRPRVFYRREIEAQSLIVAKP